jgi:hypothetical protein
MTVGTNSNKNGDSNESFNPYLTARLNKRLNTYPLPSFDGKTPSPIKKVIALAWSVITYKEKSVFSDSP